MINRRRFLSYGLGLGAATWLAACKQEQHIANKASEHAHGHAAASDAHHHHMNEHLANWQNSNQNMLKHPNEQDLLDIQQLSSGLALPALAILQNQATQPQRFEARLVADKHHLELVSGLKTECWLYNGVLGGPQIVVYEEDEVSIEFVNRLDEETTVHFHGLPVPPSEDGNPQDSVKPGQSRWYRFKLPKGCAGTYWYHTHAHGLSAQQAFKGLAGTLIVKSKQDVLAHLPEQHWLLTDMRLLKNGQMAPNTEFDWVNGREGAFVLINGAYKPNIRIQDTTRIRIWNACNGRYFKLHIPDCDIIVIGTDGGLLSEPLPAVTELLLAPAERYEVVLKPRQQGRLLLQDVSYDRHKMLETFVQSTTDLASIEYQGKTEPLPEVLRPMPPLPSASAEQYVSFSEDGNAPLQQMFKVNGQVFDMQRIDLRAKVGVVEDWLITNASHMDHPFHLHGTQFEIIEFVDMGEAQAMPYRCLKDTVNLKPYQSVRIRTKQEFKGLRMFHCHILEHESLGMMGQLSVE